MDLCSIVVQHFNKYPLFTQKRVDFLLMCKILQIIENKRHHTLEGLREIVQFKTSINLARGGHPVDLKSTGWPLYLKS